MSLVPSGAEYKIDSNTEMAHLLRTAFPASTLAIRTVSVSLASGASTDSTARSLPAGSFFLSFFAPFFYGFYCVLFLDGRQASIHPGSFRLHRHLPDWGEVPRYIWMAERMGTW